MADIHIHDGNAHMHTAPPPGFSKGLAPRDFNARPFGSLSFAAPFSLPTIPSGEVSGRLAEQKAACARCTDMRNTGMNGQQIPSRDQNQKGYCWAHSGTSAALVARAMMGEPYADLSAYAVACIIKNYRDEGGNGIDSVEFIAKRGIPTSEFWAQKSMSRANDNPKTWENAALHKYTLWMELDPSNMIAQLVTCQILGIPVVSDFNWWGHSVCSMDAVDGATQRDATRGETGKLLSLEEFDRIWDMVGETGGIGNNIWNSWSDSYGTQGIGLLTGSKARPDNAIACLTMTPSGS